MRILIWSCLYCLTFAVLGLTAQPSASSEECDRQIVITNANVFDGKSATANSDIDIVICGEFIKAIGPTGEINAPDNAVVLDGSDKWVMPGLIDVHVHNSDADYLKRMLAMGVTTVHLMPNLPPEAPLQFMERSDRSEYPSPRTHLSAMFTGKFPDNLFPGVYEFQMPKTAAAAEDNVGHLASQGYRSIKIIQDDSRLWAGNDFISERLAPSVFRALIGQARQNDMRVYVHATQLGDAREAIAGDALLHGIMDVSADEEFWTSLKRSGGVWTPTFTAPILFGDFGRYSRLVLSDPVLTANLSEAGREQFRSWAKSSAPLFGPNLKTLNTRLDAYLKVMSDNTAQAILHGIPVAVGTDGGPAGASTHLELELLSRHGLTNLEVLTAASWGGAVALGIEDRSGLVEVGYMADLVVLTANPLLDIRNTRHIKWIIKGGVLYEAKSLLGGL